MKRQWSWSSIASIWFMVLASALAKAEHYPAKPVMIITPSGAGAGPDVVARIVADRLTKAWGQQVLIVNRPGAGGLFAAQAAASAAPDGYTLYMPISSTYIVLPELQAKLPLDLARDLVPIGLIGEQPMMIAVHPSLGVTTLPELVAMARQSPGKILFGTGRGNLPHMTGEMLAQRARLDLTFVPYPSAARALQDALTGTLSLMIESPSALAGPLQGGLLRGLAVASSKRLADFPDLPTVAETMPELGAFEARGWFVLTARTATPEAIVHKIRRDLQTELDRPEVRRKLQSLGTYTRSMSVAELSAFIANEQQLWRPIVREVAKAQ
jgi:tripartite-type tricarboxylate transporter receptor subunit TctC